MPTGQPDPRFLPQERSDRFLPQERSDRFLPQERSDVGGGVAEGDGGGSPLPGSAGTPPAGGRNRGGVAEGEGGYSPEETRREYVTATDLVRARAERLIQKAMEAGEFDDLPGTGQPIPGAGTVDDELWWVRSWLQRNQDQG